MRYWVGRGKEGPLGEGGGVGDEKFKDKRQEETKHNQQGVQDKGKGESMEKRKRPLSEGAGTAGKTQRGKGVDGTGKGGGAVKKGPERKGGDDVKKGSERSHLRVQPSKKQVEGMRRGEHLRAKPPKAQVQAMGGQASASTTAKEGC